MNIIFLYFSIFILHILKLYNTNNLYTGLKKSKSKKIKRKLIDFATQSTSHGLPRIFSADKTYLKLMWFMLFVLFSILGIYKVAEMSVKYLDYEVVSRIDVINELPTEFPAVTFYNLKDSKANKTFKEISLLCIYKQTICHENDIEMSQNRDGFVSYKFNVNQKSFMSGPTYGLYLILLNVNSTNELSIRDGLRVIIHNSTINPRYNGRISAEGVDISPGFFTKLSVSRTFSAKLGEPYNKCLKDISSIRSYNSKFFNYIKEKTNYSYTQKDCFNLCIEDQILDYLNFSKDENWVEKYQSLPNITQAEVMKIFYKLIKSDLTKVCSYECPLECDSIKYDVTSSITKFTRENLLNLAKLTDNESLRHLVSNFSKEFIQDYVIGFNVYYEDLSYTYISQTPKMELSEFISNIGGILGLFIGISFLSLAELIEIFIEILLIFIHKK